VAGTTLTSGLRSYRDLLAQPGVGRLVAWGLVARLPTGMLALGVVLLVRGTGRSYADAGLVSAFAAMTFAAGAPAAGRLIDRRRPAAVLIGYGIAFPVALVVLVEVARSGAPLWALLVAAGAVGATQPPVAPTIRMLWPSLTSEALQPTAFALEATLQELFFIAGPMLVGVVTALISSSAGIAAAAAISTVGVIGFVSTDPVRRHRHQPHAHAGGHLLAALSPATVRRIVSFAACYGLAFGAVEVAMPAFAEDHGGRALSSICLAAWAGGSLVGGLLASGQRPSDPHRRLQIYGVVFAGLLALPLLAGSVPVMAVIMFVAGLPIAPSVAITYGMVQKAALPRTEAEVFGWLSTAVVVGYAAGAGVGGSLISHSGPHASIVLGMCGIVVATLIAPRPTG
jgi:predicted MFS family arabinose efflux permease